MKDKLTLSNTSPACEDDRNRLIDDYLLGKLAPEKMDDMEAHYFSCDICFQQMQRREKIIQHIQANGETLVPAYFEKAAPPPNVIKMDTRPHQSFRMMYYAAAAVVLLLITFNLPNFLGNGEPSDPVAHYADLYGEAFQPSVFMEERLNSTVRDNAVIEVLSPKNTAIMNESLNFAWKISEMDTSSGPLKLVIMNNQTEKQYEYPLEDTSFTFSEKLSPGLYYWVLEIADETWHRGRFWVLPKQ